MDRAAPYEILILPATTFGQTAARTVSRLWRPKDDQASSATSPAPGKSFVVPLFLSRPPAQDHTYARGAIPPSTRSRTSTRSVIEDDMSGAAGVRPLSVPRDNQSEVSDMYTGSSQYPESVAPVPLARNMDDDPTPSERQASRSQRSGSNSSTSHSSKHGGRKRSIFSRKSYRDPDVSSKARISFAFGLTLLVTLIIYLVLAATGIAKNIFFHVITILFLLALTGVFIHQLLRMFILIRHPRKSRRHRTAAHSSRRGGGRTKGHSTRTHRQRTRKPAEPELIPEKPIPIHMSSDTSFEMDLEAQTPAVQVPPPVYGNFRSSMRINPDLVHWKEVQAKEPSPLTPTYDDAVNQIHQTMGYRPPSYLSEGGGTEGGRPAVTSSMMGTIHPLERERLRTLTAAALEGRRVHI